MSTSRNRPGWSTWPTGHVGWAFAGSAEYEGRATTFLAEGTLRNERLMFVADDPDVGLWPRWLRVRGALIVASTSEIYGSERLVDPPSQRATFAGVLAEALGEGYAGIRIAADNTSLIDGPEHLAAWTAWEVVADRFIEENPVTGLCAFDRTRAEAHDLQVAMSHHRVMPS